MKLIKFQIKNYKSIKTKNFMKKHPIKHLMMLLDVIIFRIIIAINILTYFYSEIKHIIFDRKNQIVHIPRRYSDICDSLRYQDLEFVKTHTDYGKSNDYQLFLLNPGGESDFIVDEEHFENRIHISTF